jgi:hypothetical protein
VLAHRLSDAHNKMVFVSGQGYQRDVYLSELHFWARQKALPLIDDLICCQGWQCANTDLERVSLLQIGALAVCLLGGHPIDRP